MKRPRRKTGSKHISLSATDAEWTMLRDNAQRRGLPLSRYIVDLAERDGRAADPGLDVALPATEQRELLDGVREIRSLMLGDGDTEPLVRDMQSRIAVQFTAWSASMVRTGREQDLRAALGAVLGDDRARAAADRAVAEARTQAEAAGAADQRDADRHDERQGRLL